MLKNAYLEFDTSTWLGFKVLNTILIRSKLTEMYLTEVVIFFLLLTKFFPKNVR